MDSERDLSRVRRCAQLTIPAVLPMNKPRGEMVDKNGRPLPENFQSLGARMVSSMAAHMVTNGFPADSPWMQLEVPGPMWFDPAVPERWKIEARRELHFLEMEIASILESAPVGEENRNSLGFLVGIWQIITHSLVTGDGLARIGDDMRIRPYRLDNYVTERDSAGDVLFHVVREWKDPLTLPREQIEKAGFKFDELKEKKVRDRMCNIYSRPEWQPLTKKWTICQECNGQEIFEDDEKFTPYISAPMMLIGGDNYGRGLAELNHGDLWTFDQLERSTIDMSAIASQMKVVCDTSCLVRDEDFEGKSGNIVRNARVSGGLVQDFAFMTVNKGADFGIVQAVRDAKRKDLGSAALLESESAPTGEAGRHSTAWKMVYNEIQRITGGQYVTMMGAIQPTIVRWCMHKTMQKRPAEQRMRIEKIKVRYLTGLAAMKRDAEKQKLLGLAQFLQTLGPEAAARLDPAVAAEVWARYDSFYEPGLVKSDAKVQAETQQAVRTQLQLAAGEKATEVIGNAAQAALVPQAA